LVALLWVAALWFVAGLVLFKIFDHPVALVLTLLSLVIVVMVGWYEAHPGRGGDVGRPDIGWPYKRND
jgi:hypothetical protein